ncbi:YgjV family protein [Salinispira pacifica]|nr:YgjV family protein [Salinispira pacifica]
MKMTVQTVELFGYAASFFVAVSLLMASLVKLRVLNLIGCTFFVVYGLLLNAIPIVITNGFIMIVNTVYLIQMYRKDISSFRYEPVAGTQIDQLMEFVQIKKKDIQKFYPYFSECQLRAASGENGIIYSARRGGRNQGFAYALKHGGLELSRHCKDSKDLQNALTEVQKSEYSQAPVFFADYIVPKYRDLGLAHTFHEQLIEDLRNTYREILWINHQGNRTMSRLLKNEGYTLLSVQGDYEILMLRLQKP